MPHINDLKESKYLKQSDIGRGALVTVKGLMQKNIAKKGEEPEHRWLVFFNELEKPLVLNSTNAQLAARVCGSENTDDWTGRQLVLYTDPNVSYAGKLVGGIRIRAPKPQAVAPVAQAQKQTIAQAAAKWTQSHAMPAAAPEPVEEMLADDDIPFSWVIGLVATGMTLLHLAPILI